MMNHRFLPVTSPCSGSSRLCYHFENKMVAATNNRFLLQALLIVLLRRRRRRRRLQYLLSERAAPSFWQREIYAKREQLGEFHTLVLEMRTSDREMFFR